jgi:hypothetical protein
VRAEKGDVDAERDLADPLPFRLDQFDKLLLVSWHNVPRKTLNDHCLAPCTYNLANSRG